MLRSAKMCVDDNDDRTNHFTPCTIAQSNEDSGPAPVPEVSEIERCTVYSCPMLVHRCDVVMLSHTMMSPQS